MRFWEALKEMQENGKTCFSEKADVTLSIKNNNFQVKSMGFFFSLSDAIGDDSWQIIEEPKKKVKLYKWAYRKYPDPWIEDPIFYEDVPEGWLGVRQFMRLDHTMIEVDEK